MGRLGEGQPHLSHKKQQWCQSAFQGLSTRGAWVLNRQKSGDRLGEPLAQSVPPLLESPVLFILDFVGVSIYEDHLWLVPSSAS